VTGCSRVEKESLGYHVKSVVYERAVSDKLAKQLKDQNETIAIEKGFQKANEKILIKMDKPFRTAYYIAKNERPFTDFKDLLQLQKINGPDVGEKYFIAA
jgi:hypothetical protein